MVVDLSFRFVVPADAFIHVCRFVAGFSKWCCNGCPEVGLYVFVDRKSLVIGRHQMGAFLFCFGQLG